MPDFEYHMGEMTETPTQVSFTLVVRDGTGAEQLGVTQITLPKPLTPLSVRTAILNAANGMIAPATKPKEFVEELLRRMNRGL